MSQGTKAPILVIEDDVGIRGNLTELLQEYGFGVVSSDNGLDGIALARERCPALVLCDIMLPRADGYAVLRELRREPATSSVPFIFLTARGDRGDVRHGMNLGADDYLTKPFSLHEVIEAVLCRLSRHEALRHEVRSVTESKESPELRARTNVRTDDGAEIIAPAMRALYDEAARVAASPINVVVLGESGAGKELLSRAIHSFSPRRAGPFVALNCAALSESLVLSELFGYERGAFTGALQSRAGLLESASGGTLFLDEVGELPLSMQSKLLRVIEEKKFMRVGARNEREVDVRFVAATNRDLDEEVAAGRFRQDLHFRLNGVSLTVPPLRERREEIRTLANMFLARAQASLKVPPLSIDEATLEVLERYPFPGNVRELKNLIERGAALCRGPVLLVEHLPEKVRWCAERSGKSPGGELCSPSGASSWPSVPPSSRRGERHQILEALEKCAGNQTRAADLLGISRRTLVTRLGELDIPRPRKR